MGFGALRSIALRSIARPLCRTLVSRSTTSFAASSVCPKPELRLVSGRQAPWFFPLSSYFHSLTDTRFPKRRPGDKPRRKRASVRRPVAFAGVQCVPGEPIVLSRPNEGSVKRRNEKKRMRQRRAFILAEKKKRKTLVQLAKKTKNIKRIESKMAAVARDRAWAQRLAELQQLEEEKKKSMA